MVHEKPLNRDEVEVKRIIRRTGPPLMLLFGVCGAASGALSEGGEKVVFLYASFGFGFLSALVGAMYGAHRLIDAHRKKIRYTTKEKI